MPLRKKVLTKSYQFKLPNDERLDWFQAHTTKAAQKLLEELWSEEWISKLGESGLKAYKVINEAQVLLPDIYLPSRIRRGVAEWAGRILRGQYKRMDCYYDCLKVVNWLGVETNENKLVAVVMQHCRTKSKNGKTYPLYKKMMVEQTIRMIKNWHKKLSIDFSMFEYIDFVEPTIQNFTFPFGPDDKQAIQYQNDGQTIYLRMKLPNTAQPRSIADWLWVEIELTIAGKIREKILMAISEQPRKPTLITKTLKGGLCYFFLQFPWDYPKKPRKERPERVLAIDLGLKKLATCVICQDRKQISKPIVIKLKGLQYRHIERFYTHIVGIQKKLSKFKKQNRAYLGVNIEEERKRLYRKKNRLGNELAFVTTNALLQIAEDWQCTKIVIEDLRDYKPPRGRRSWSRKMSEWLHGRIAFQLEYNCQEAGFILQKICPWNTSTHCPRCTAKGQKVLGPNNLVQDKKGRWFNCLTCGFTADRDYIAAVNIYRASFINYRTIKNLKDTNPIPYMDIGTPRSTVPSGGSEMNCTNTIVVVTGNG